MNKLLILGGTNFIGRNLVDTLIELNKFNITLFNRGKTNCLLFPEIKKIQGDRNTADIHGILDNNWDYIIDLSCYFPNSLDNVLPKINTSLKRYIFISTCSVYDNQENTILLNENIPTLLCDKNECIDNSLVTYGKRKAECERILIKSGLKYTIFRPALVYGKYDTTDRFYYWLYQVKNNKSLLIPNKGKSLFSATYVMDLVQVIIKSLSINLTSNIYNVTTFPKSSISGLIDKTAEILNKKPLIYDADTQFLHKNKVKEWFDLPLWIDSDCFTFDNSKIVQELNMKITDFEDSLLKTIIYYNQLGWKIPKYGLQENVKNGLIKKLNES